MAIYVKTSNPEGLVNNIKEKIQDKHIETWICDSAGDFTHNTDQWRYHAWMRARVEVGKVVFSILCRNDRSLTITEYAVYHGRFAEMLLTHFDKSIDGLEITPLATKYDVVD